MHYELTVLESSIIHPALATEFCDNPFCGWPFTNSTS